MQDDFSFVASRYLQAAKEPFSDHPVANHVRNDLVEVVKDQLSSDYGDLKIKGSVGQTNWAAIPWIAFFDPLITTTAQAGFYVVYLYGTDMNNLYLSLNQGTTAVYHEFGPRYGRQVLRARADLMRTRVKEHTDGQMTEVISLQDDGPLALGYEAGHAVGYRYDLASLPPDDVMVSDLHRVLRLYRHLVFRGGVTPSDVLLETAVVKDIEEAHRYQLVRRLERNAAVRKKVLSVKSAVCEACGLSPQVDYKLPSEKLPLDVHHLTPISELQDGERLAYKIPDDFAVLCPTCHRVAHQMTDPGDIEALQGAIRFKHARLVS